jgi:hypothetical protein
MSVRAYRVNKKEVAENSSFNCWHDSDILEIFEQHGFFDERNCDGAGDIGIPVSTLEELLAKYPWEAGKDYRRDAIQADITWAREQDRKIVEYHCY